ncbi:MAG: Uma2 family endonuclease [Planctomycetes bacterium]|nr:Uma2 family endonuclease [Planctomycetota bacterium]
MPAPAQFSILLQPEGVRLPGRLDGFARFRAWTRSEEFPEQGRIDWMDGEVEVDLSPEEANTQGTVKVAITRGLDEYIDERDLGVCYVDRMRYVSPEAGLSAEPDVMVVFYETLESGKARLVPATPGSERMLEIEGRVDLVVEVVSGSSVVKDNEKLLKLYHRAGVREYWLVDARAAVLSFTLYQHHSRAYVPAPVDSRGFRASRVLGSRVRLIRRPRRAGVVRWHLEWSKR